MIDFDISKVVACARRRNTDLSQTMPSHANPKEYLRFGDGDYELSAVEEEGFVIGRTRPRFRLLPLPRSDIASDHSGTDSGQLPHAAAPEMWSSA